MTTPMTPHATWKSLCRILESKPFVRRFGSDVARKLDTYAIFEISQAQLDDETIHMDMSAVPPLPFPKMLLVMPQLAISIEQPRMDLDTGVLEYDSMLFTSLQAGRCDISFAMLRYDASKTTEDAITVSDLRCQFHYEEIGDYPDERGLISTEFKDQVHDALRSGRHGAEERQQLQEYLDGLKEAEVAHVEEIRKSMHGFFCAGLSYIHWINRPKHYIVEQGPEIVRNAKKKDGDRVRRLGERSRYIIIEHKEVRRRWTAAQGTHASPMPHLRRGHTKTLRAERYGDKRGTVIWVSPCHVNGACVEWRHGDVSYKVIG